MSKDLRSYAGRVTVTDGGWGTQLQEAGLPAGMTPDVWNLDNRDAVLAVARSYVEAGSQIILTNTFRSTALLLGTAERAAEIVQAGAAISREAGGDSVAVFGSIGPTGKIMMMGEVSPEQVTAACASAAKALAAGGVDAIICESFADLAELVLAVRAVRESTDLAVVASMTFDSGPDRTVTMMGNKPADLASAAAGAGAAAVGANCGAGPDSFVKVAAMLREATDLPIWIKPNAGLPVLREGETVFPLDPDQFAGFAPALIQAGANLLGGCCGTTPEHIRAIRAAIK